MIYDFESYKFIDEMRKTEDMDIKLGPLKSLFIEAAVALIRDKKRSKLSKYVTVTIPEVLKKEILEILELDKNTKA